MTLPTIDFHTVADALIVAGGSIETISESDHV